MKKQLYIGSNFKMYKNIRAPAATRDIDREKVQFFFIPSYTSLESASKTSVPNQFMLGAQNMCWESADVWSAYFKMQETRSPSCTAEA